MGRLSFLTATVLAGVSVALVIVNGLVVMLNQQAQAEINQRQLQINQGIQMARLTQGLVQALAMSAANNKDDQLRDLLAQHGINFTVNPPAEAPAAGKN